MATEKEVAAKLTISREGDASALKEASADAQALGAAASSAAPGFAELEAAINSLDATGFEDLKKALDDLIAARKRFEAEGDPSKQLPILDQMAAAWTRVAAEIDKAGGNSKEMAADIEKQLAALRADARGIADPIGASFEAAAAKVKSFEAAAEKGLGSSKREAAQARAAIDQYKAAVDAAARSGGNIADAQIADLRQLEAQYQRAIATIGRFQSTQRQANLDIERSAQSTGTAVRGINSLNDIGQLLPGTFGRIAGGAIAMGESFSFGYRIGTQLNDLFNQITNNGAAEWIQRNIFGWEGLGLSMEEAATAARLYELTLARQRDAFNDLGIPMRQFTDDLAKNRELIAEAEGRYSRWVESMKLSRQSLLDLTKELLNFQHQASQDPDLNNSGLVEVRKKQLQELLDQYQRLGIEAGPYLENLAKSWGVLTTEQQKAADESKRRVEQMVQSLTGAKALMLSQWRQYASEVQQALATINIPQVQAVDPKQFEVIKTKVQEVIELFRQAGEQIPAEMVKAADSVGVFVAPMERAHGAITVFNGSASLAGGATQELTRHVDELGNVSFTLAQKVSGAGAATQQTAGQIANGSTALSGMADSASRASSEVERVGSITAAAGTEASSGLSQLGEAAEGAASAVSTASQQISEGSSGLKDQAAAGKDAAQGVGEAAEKWNVISGATSTAASALKEVTTAAESTGEVMPKVASAVEGIAAALAKLAGLGNAFDTIITGAETALGKLDQLEAKLDAIAEKAS